jgi:hypothetical protein
MNNLKDLVIDYLNVIIREKVDLSLYAKNNQIPIYVNGKLKHFQLL